MMMQDIGFVPMRGATLKRPDLSGGGALEAHSREAAPPNPDVIGKGGTPRA